MGNFPLTVFARDYDFLSPLATGDVVAKGFDLTLVRDTANALKRVMEEPGNVAGETSFSKHLIRLSKGDQSYVAIPFMVTRAFRERCFIVPRGSDIKKISDLSGKRIGTDDWRATGNTWSRAVMREQGVDMDSITWWVGSIDGGVGKGPAIDLPDHVSEAPLGRGLLAKLLDDELDALMIPMTPPELYQPNGPIVRLIPDFRAAEQETYRRTGINPIHHIIVIRADAFERNPQVAVQLYDALSESRRVWYESRRRLADTTPWLLAELEDSKRLFGADYLPDGAEPNRHVTQALINEQLALGLTSTALDPDEVFAQFEEVRTGVAATV